MPVERAASGQIIPKEKASYNERLFQKGWRRYIHEARYHWLREKIKETAIRQPSIIELGCFDAKTIDYLPSGFSRYAGYDANWENGLQLGRHRWAGNSSVTLIESHEPATFNPEAEVFDCSIALETLEHLPLSELDTYLGKLAAATSLYCFISVPYEQGLPLLFKYGYKTLLRKVDEPYSLRELVAATTGKLSKVERVERGHKGFDYRRFLESVRQHFEIVEVSALPFRSLPQQLNFSVGIVARPRRHQ